MASSNQDPFNRRKLALIIGNGDYHRSENRLNSSTNNARELSNVLKAIHFEVEINLNRSKYEMTTDIVDFSKRVHDGDLILFYFTGHGYQLNDKNYLIPIDDAKIETNRDIEDFTVDVELMLTRLIRKNPSYATVLILDCSSPYLLPGVSTSHCNGLYEMNAPAGTFIQFACAADQSTSNDLFIKRLLKNIAQENVHVSDVFDGITNQVYQESNRQQRPFFRNGLHQHQQVYLNGKYFLDRQVLIKNTSIERFLANMRIFNFEKISSKNEHCYSYLIFKGNELAIARFLTKEPLLAHEKSYYDSCKTYYELVEQPLIVVPDEVFDNRTAILSSSIKLGIDEDCNKFNLRDFLNKFCAVLSLNMNDITVKRIQVGSTILEAEIYNKFLSSEKRLRLQIIYGKLMDEKVQKELAKMQIFFMFMGPIDVLDKIQKFRTEIKLNPQYNRVYDREHDFWLGPLDDGKDRGGAPYYCPVGWQRSSFYVTDQFDEKFKGWCICYHGTKFAHGLSILLSGLKPADKAEHGSGIYATPSINYACHPRYAEVKKIQSPPAKKFFKSGSYVQFVLECRVHPNNITKIAEETLDAADLTIDSNISNDVIEWIIDNQEKKVVDFNDPDATIICTGILIRVTDKHPGLLPESQWWSKAHLCDDSKCCALDVDLDSLKKQKQKGEKCRIIFT